MDDLLLKSTEKLARLLSLLILVIITGCGFMPQPVIIKTSTVPASTATVMATAAALDLLPNPTPFDLSEESVGKAMTEWIAAYNARDEQHFLAHLSDAEFNGRVQFKTFDVVAQFEYGDCDFTDKSVAVLHTRREVRDWIRQRWAEDDKFQLRDIILVRGSGETVRAGKDPFAGMITGVGLDIQRTNQYLPHGSNLGFKIVFERRGTNIRGLIQYASLEGQCNMS